MNPIDVIKDPIYQLNLMLWLLQPLKNNYPLRPVLKELGYELFAIGPSMPLSPELRERLKELSISCAEAPEPDLLISRNKTFEFITIECKAQMFGPASEKQADQARALLLQNGEQFNLAIGLEIDASPDIHLVYVAKHSETYNLEQGICQIQNELREAGLDPVRTGAIGIDFYQDKVYLRNNYGQGEIPKSLKETIGEGIIIQKLFPDDNPISLFYIPWDPNVFQSDEMANYCEQVFCERILTEIACRIGTMFVPGIIEFEYDNLLNAATSNFYEHWHSKTIRGALRNFCRELLSKALKSTETHFEKSTLPQPRQGIALNISNEETRESIIDSLTKFKRGKWIRREKLRQTTLFSEDDI
ncbi:TPA: hypothetical protein DCX16_06130 [bacterium]|nr:hypothetical protein [bacterium]